MPEKAFRHTVGKACQVGGQEEGLWRWAEGGTELALSTASDLGLGQQLRLDSLLVAAPSPGPLGVSLLQADPFPAETSSAAHLGIYSLSAGHGCFCVWERGWGFFRVLT